MLEAGSRPILYLQVHGDVSQAERGGHSEGGHGDVMWRCLQLQEGRLLAQKLCVDVVAGDGHGGQPGERNLER